MANDTLTIQSRMVYERGRAYKVYDACAGLLLVATERTEAAARKAAIDNAMAVLANVWQYRVYRYDGMTYVIHANASGGYTVEHIHDSDELATRGTSSNGCVVYGPEQTFDNICRSVERQISERRHPLPYATCPACGYSTFAPNLVDPIPSECANPGCRASLVAA